MPMLGLDPSPHSKVYRALVEILQADATLNPAVKRWVTWNDQGSDRDPWRPPMDGELPQLDIVPSEGSGEWFGPSGFRADLVCDLVVTVDGIDAEDAFDLYFAIIRAIYPGGDATPALHRTLVAAGALAHNLVRFSHPSYSPVRGESSSGDPLLRMVAAGQLAVPVEQLVNP